MASKPSAKTVARSATQATQRHYDTLTNVVAGLGMAAKDKGASDVFGFREIGKDEIDNAYRGDWLVRKIVDIPANDMTREWREWQAEDKQIEDIEVEETRLGIRRKVRRALQLARLYGGAALILGVNQGQPQEELRVDSIKQGDLKFVHVLHRHQLTVGDLERDPMSEFFGEPKSYTINATNAASVTLHPSRVIRFIGQPVPDEQALSTQGWGDTVLAALYSALHDATLSLQITASLVHEAKIDVVRVPNLMANLATSEYRNRLIERFTLAALGKSVANTLLMDKEEEWEQKTLNFAGLPDLARLFLQVASGAADIPVTRLLGESPAGLNATGAADIRNYYDGLSSRQEDELRPALKRVDDVMIPSAIGSLPDELWYEFKPLWQMTEAERAEIALKKAQTTQVYANTGMVPGDALAQGVQNQLIEDGTYPGLDQAIADSEEALAAEPDLAAEAAAEGDVTKQPPTSAARANSGAAPPGNPQQQQQRRAANDATPRTLYVSRQVKNAAPIIEWAKGQGFKTTLPAADLHVTVTFSRTPVDWMLMGSTWGDDEQGRMKIPVGGPRLVEKLGKAVVLMFSSSQLSWRHEDMVRQGASWDHPSYQPHISITYDTEGVDIAKVEPYQGEIVLGPEIFQEVVDDWEKSISEEAA